MNLPQDGIKLHRGNFTAIGRQIQPYLEDGKCFRMVLKPWRERRSLSQNALSHMWYSEISEYLISKGKTFATPAWVSKSFPKQAGTWGNTETPNGTVTVTISDDHNFDRQIIIPPIIFNGIAYSDPGSGNNRCCRLSTCRQHVSRTGRVVGSVSVFQRRNGIDKGP